MSAATLYVSREPSGYFFELDDDDAERFAMALVEPDSAARIIAAAGLDAAPIMADACAGATFALRLDDCAATITFGTIRAEVTAP